MCVHEAVLSEPVSVTRHAVMAQHVMCHVQRVLAPGEFHVPMFALTRTLRPHDMMCRSSQTGPHFAGFQILIHHPRRLCWNLHSFIVPWLRLAACAHCAGCC